MVEKTELELAEDWVEKLNPHEKKRIFGGNDPTFGKWWPSLTNVDKLGEYNKWKAICPGTKAVAKAKMINQSAMSCLRVRFGNGSLILLLLWSVVCADVASLVGHKERYAAGCVG